MAGRTRKGSVLRCDACGHDCKPQRVADIDVEALGAHECTQCGEVGGIRWVVNLLYREETTGEFLVEKGFRLDREVRQEDRVRGETLQDPRILAGTRVFRGSEKERSVKAFWLPYWISIEGTKKFGQFAPIVSEDAFVELLSKAIRGGAFGEKSLESLRRVLEDQEN